MNASKKARVNEQIRAPKVRLIDHEGGQVGVVSLAEARQAALERELDLVEISPNVDPPVCRLLDYGKYLFEQRKKQVSAKKKQKRVQVKEIKFRPTTEEGDYQVKLRNIMRFLEHGEKVKVTVRFRGREMAHREFGLKILKRVEQDLEESSILEQAPKLEGRQMIMIIAPQRTK